MEEYHLRVYSGRSQLVEEDGSSVTFMEGAADKAAIGRHKQIKDALDAGFLTNEIESCIKNPMAIDHSDLTDEQRENLSTLVSSMTSEVGRAIIGLSVLQLTVKSICPEQNIRLHKSGNRSTFGWQDGIPMRPLDAAHITPALRKYGLLKLNAFGFMMTRTLAENYPYSKVYKAGIRGGRDNWLQIVEGIEDNVLPPRPALRFLLAQLLNSATEFRELSERTLSKVVKAIDEEKFKNTPDAIEFFKRHMKESQYAARIMEISMHSLMQSIQEMGGFPSWMLKPLSQMRSANKKHGNIGDIELLEGSLIIHAWDAKYGKSYLRDEIDELVDKIEHHPTVKFVGFVTSGNPDMGEEIVSRLSDVEDTTGIKVSIESFDSWVANRIAEAIHLGLDERSIINGWVFAYTESLAQRRPEIAPIDEPCFQWMKSLDELL